MMNGFPTCLSVALSFIFSCTALFAADTLSVYSPVTPLLMGNEDNVLAYMKLYSDEPVNRRLRIVLGADSDVSLLESVKLYYSGTEARQTYSDGRFRHTGYISSSGSAVPSYSVLLDEKDVEGRTTVLDSDVKLFRGVNYLWVSLKLSRKCRLTDSVSLKVLSADADGDVLEVRDCSRLTGARRAAVAVRRAGDDGVAAYRIPGLVTTSRGTLIAVYDVRYNSSADLQEHIDIGMSRSTDGGETWEKMRIPLSFSGYGGLPDSQNGVGDPCVLYDPVRERIWIAAAWCHGMGNQRAWWSSCQGMDVYETAQLVLCYSDDDGLSWSDPVNVTPQVKKPEWHFLLQGPGRGIVADDGTLIFPIQFIGSDRVPNAGVMYSRDGGDSWHIGSHARSNTTESQAVQLSDGSIMLNMRDNRGGSRAVAVSGDLGHTWTEHGSSRSALREPVCMASIIRLKPSENITGRDLLVFSNPDSDKDRKDITVKFSLDGGDTWPEKYNVLLDEGHSWGYSCLTLVDEEHVGILYESSVANMTFQVIPVKDIFEL